MARRFGGYDWQTIAICAVGILLVAAFFLLYIIVGLWPSLLRYWP